jgi:hypothetical protein
MRGAGTHRDRADAHVTEVNVPAFVEGVFRSAAGEGWHGAIEPHAAAARKSPYRLGLDTTGATADRGCSPTTRIALLTHSDANNSLICAAYFLSIQWESTMAVVVQYVVKPNPGSDLGGIIELAKESAALWRKYGGKARFWSVAVGEAGNYVFSINFETFSSYGAAVDKLNADPAFQTWQAKRLKAGLTTLVRANMATEIEI